MNKYFLYKSLCLIDLIKFEMADFKMLLSLIFTFLGGKKCVAKLEQSFRSSSLSNYCTDKNNDNVMANELFLASWNMRISHFICKRKQTFRRNSTMSKGSNFIAWLHVMYRVSRPHASAKISWMLFNMDMELRSVSNIFENLLGTLFKESPENCTS